MRFWPFRRRAPKPPGEDLRTSADWKVGDLAVCVADDWHTDWPENPKVKDMLRVSAIDLCFNIDGAFRFIGLGFYGKSPAKRWSNTCFRKAQINHEPGTMSIDEMIRRHSKEGEPFLAEEVRRVLHPEKYGG